MYRIKQIERGQAIGKLADQTEKKNKEQNRRIRRKVTGNKYKYNKGRIRQQRDFMAQV